MQIKQRGKSDKASWNILIKWNLDGWFLFLSAVVLERGEVMMSLCTSIIGVAPVKSRLHQNVDTSNFNRKQMLTNDAMRQQVTLLVLSTPFSLLFNHKNIQPSRPHPITFRSVLCFENASSYSHLRLLMLSFDWSRPFLLFIPPPQPTHPPKL